MWKLIWKELIATYILLVLLFWLVLSTVVAFTGGCATVPLDSPEFMAELQSQVEAVVGAKVDVAPVVGGNGDSVALWLAIAALGGLPLAYPVGRAVRRRREKNGS